MAINPCGAKTRAGGKCQAPAMANGRCRVHGGANNGAPKGSRNAAKPGNIYSAYLTDEENAVLTRLEIGKIEDELRLCKIRLMRALKAETNDPEIEQVTAKADGGIEEVRKRRDYSGLIDRLMGRIASLEKDRLSLIDAELNIELKRADLAGKKEESADAPTPASVIIEVRDARKPNAVS